MSIKKVSKRFTYFLLCFSFTSIFYSFNHGDKDNSSNRPSTLIDIQVPILSNPSFSTDAFVYRGKDNLFYVTVPENLNGNFINVDFLTLPNSILKVNGDIITQNSTVINEGMLSVSTATINIQNNIQVEIITPSGYKEEYDLLIQKGNKDIDSLIYSFKERYNIPGISLAVASIDSTKTIYQVGYGYGIKESKSRVLPNHLFRLASMSKQHTAIAILKLIQDGKFGIDDYVFGMDGILKDEFPRVPAKASRITVRHLLEHTSGYRTHPDYMFGTPYAGWSMKQRIQAMLKSNQLNEPGKVFAYYNTGYGILGYIIEYVSGKNYETFLKEMYASVGVNDIHVGGTQSERRSNEVAYYGQNRANAEGLDMNIRASAGGLIASTDELLKLLWTLDGKSNIPDILSEDYRQMMFTPSSAGHSRYALGWRTNHQYFPNSFYHGGTLAGVSTFWVYAEGYAVIILCNSRNPSSTFDDALYKIARDIIINLRNEEMSHLGS